MKREEGIQIGTHFQAVQRWWSLECKHVPIVLTIQAYQLLEYLSANTSSQWLRLLWGVLIFHESLVVEPAVPTLQVLIFENEAACMAELR